MTESERESLVSAWIAAEEQYDVDATARYNDPTIDLINDLSRNEPDEAWEFINAVLAQHPSDKVVAVLAAGPLEDLLAHHGDEFIDRVEERAREDDAFNLLLGGVWRNSMKLRIWRRVEKARKSVW